ncbi:MAG TPA: DUF5675 family protein [Blastocatellia bacterium]|nr:DUF5675 family protein [Blastocatellia bacterium]
MATELLLERKTLTDKSTVGEISINGRFQCYTLEDVVRSHKIKSQTAIPAGRYQIKITPSARFKRDLPLLLDVPEFEGIRIHPGNTDADTEGCILVGLTRKDNFIGESRRAFDQIFSSLRYWLTKGEVWITIKNPAGSPDWGG